MKKIIFYLFFTAILLPNHFFAQNVAINDNGASPNSNAILDIDISTNDKGILIPRLTSSQRTAMTLAASDEGLTVYDETTNSFWFFDGSNWVEMSNGGGTGWLLTGNSLSGGEFLGTLTNDPLLIKTANTDRVRITTHGQIEVLNTGNSVFLGEAAGINDNLDTNANTFVGWSSGTSNTDGSHNVAIGDAALYSNISGLDNTAVGHTALQHNTADGNTAVGSGASLQNTFGHENVAVGYRTLYLNSTGSQNTAIGYEALNKNTGNLNTAVGYTALHENTTGASNTAVGLVALYSNTTGADNTGIGDNALSANTTGNQNTAIGKEAMAFNTSGDGNTAMGYHSLYKDTTSRNSAFGYKSLENNTSGHENTAVGNDALRQNQTGIGNSAVGSNALRNNTASGCSALGYSALYSNTSGANNTASGVAALYSNTTGELNTAHGGYALYLNTTGSNNTAIGYDALHSNNTADGNTAVGTNSLNHCDAERNTALGFQSGYQITSGRYNTLVGYDAGNHFQTGESNTAVGYQAYYCYNFGGSPVAGSNDNTAIGRYSMFFTPGDDNVAVGYYSFSNHNSGDKNVAIGAFAEPNANNPSNCVMIGYDASVQADNCVAIGCHAEATQANTIILGGINGVNDATVTSKVGIGTQTPRSTLQVTSPNLGPNDATITISPIGKNSSSSSEFSLIDFWSTFDNYSTDQAPRRTASIKAYFSGGTWGNERLSFYVGNDGNNDGAVLPVERVRLTGGYTQYVANSWTSLSDKRLKSNVQIIPYGLNEIMQLEPIIYDMHLSPTFDYDPAKISDKTYTDIGFIAQDVYKIIPEMVTKPNNEKEFWGIKYEKIVPVLVKAMQEQQNQIIKLQKDNQNLQQTIDQLMQTVNQMQQDINNLKNQK